MNFSTQTKGALRSRITAVTLVITVASLSLLNVTAGAAANPGFVLYSAQGYDKATVTAFNATHPGFTVTLNDNSTGPLLQQIQAEGNNPKWGALWVDGATAFAELDLKGMLVKKSVPKVSFNTLGKANIPADGSFTPTGLTVTGALCYLLAIRPARAATGVTLIFITLGLDVALRGLGLFVWGTNPLSLPAFTGGAAITVFGGVLPPQAMWVLLTDLLVFAALYLFFRHTYAGTAVRAAVANPPIASTFGIPLRTFAFWSFVAAAAIGGLGGVVVAPITSATYDMGLTLGLAGFVAAVLGGLDSLPGALVGGFVLGIVEKLAGGVLSTGWEQGVGFLILVLVLVLRPQGLLGRAVRRA